MWAQETKLEVLFEEVLNILKATKFGVASKGLHSQNYEEMMVNLWERFSIPENYQGGSKG